MSRENVEMIKGTFEAFEHKGLDGLADYWDEAIDWRAAEGAIDDRGPMHGKEAVRAYLQDWLDMFDDFKVEPVELIAVGDDRVVAVQQISGRARQSGIEAPRWCMPSSTRSATGRSCMAAST
jgi:ketosteroid isomerase-like protein